MKWIFLRLVRLEVFAFWPSFPLCPLRERPPLPRVRAVNRINLVCWPQNWDLLNSQLKPTPASTKATAEGGVRDTHTNARELNMHAHSLTVTHTHARQYMFLKACEKVKLRTVSHSLQELLHPHRTHKHSLTHAHPISTATMRLWHRLTLRPGRQLLGRVLLGRLRTLCAPALWKAASATVFTFPLAIQLHKECV